MSTVAAAALPAIPIAPTKYLSDTFCPYRGLVPFEEEDSPFFVGRAVDADIIIANLYASPLTVLYGASGVGKTSVLQAGVIPEVRKAALDGGDRPAVALFREWQRADFEVGLRAAIRAGVAIAGADPGGLDDALPLDRFLAKSAELCDGPIFLIFDQFEEYFLYNPASRASVGFEAELARAVNQRGLHANFLIALREEGLGKLDRFRTRIPHVMSNLLRLQPLDREAARECIEKPLETYNALRKRAGRSEMRIDPALVDELLRQDFIFNQGGRGHAGDEEGVDLPVSTELPFLQLVLTSLWAAERLAGSGLMRSETLRRLGGAKGVVRDHFIRALQRLDRRQQRIASKCFSFLVTPSYTKIAWSPGELSVRTGFHSDEIGEVLRRLEEERSRVVRRIRRASAGSEGEWDDKFELTHDALAPAVLEWQTRFELRRRHNRTRLRAAAVFVGVGLLLFAWEWYRAAQLAREINERTRREREVSAAGFAARAELVFKNSPAQSLALADSSLGASDTRQGEEAWLRARFDDQFEMALDDGRRRMLMSVRFSPDGHRLVSAGEGGASTVWSLDTRGILSRLGGFHADTVLHADFSSTGQWVVTAGRDRAIGVWDASTGRLMVPLRGLPAPIFSTTFTPDGRFLLAVDERGSGLRADTRTWQMRPWFRSLGFGAATSVSVDTYGARALVGSQYSMVSMWSVPGGQRLKVFENSPQFVYMARFDPRGDLIATASRDGNARLWTTDRFKIQTLEGHTDWVQDVDWSRDGSLLATASRDGTVRVWDARSGQVISVLRGPGGGIRSAVFSPDGRRLASAHSDGVVRVWRVRVPSKVLRVLRNTSVTDSAQGANGWVKLRVRGGGVDVNGRELTFDRTGVLDPDSIVAAIFTPDARWVVAATWDLQVVARRLTDGLTVLLPPSDGGLPRLWFSPDGAWVVAADPQGGAAVYPCDVCGELRRHLASRAAARPARAP